MSTPPLPDPRSPRPGALAGAATLGALGALGALALIRLPRIAVEGASMVPTLAPGERLLVMPWGVRPGRLVVVEDPRRRDRLLVKRAAAIDAVGVQVEGDNPAVSTDSRHFGRVPHDHVVGRPVYRYEPAEAAGCVWRA